MSVPANGVGQLKFIQVTTLPCRLNFHDTIVGGLSGLDYDAERKHWIAVSDDKSEFSPARCYELRLDYNLSGFEKVEVMGVTILCQPDGSPYPSAAQVAAGKGGVIPDLESVRWDPVDGSLWYTSEGDRALGMQPFLRQAKTDGQFLAEFPLPEMLRVHPHEEKGPRHNLSFEGFTFAPDGRSLWLALESARYEDGPESTLARGALARFTHFGRDGRVLAQFAYAVEPIPERGAPGRWNNNGVSETLAINDHEFLFLERCVAQAADGAVRFYIQMFAADIAGATDIKDLPSLTAAQTTVIPMQKRLLLDFRSVGLPRTDNLEGLAWGPSLENGHASLVVITDDNFTATEQEQIWLFEVMPPAGRTK